MNPEEKNSPAQWQHWLAAILAALVTTAVYWQVREFDFVNFDDPDYVSANPRVQAGLTVETIRWAFTEAHACNWHPITWLSLAADCDWFGVNPGKHHLVNLGFHVMNTLLLFWLLGRTTGHWWRAVVVAGLFALHPLHVESVAWIAERRDVLSTFFGLLTLIAYAAYAKKMERGRWGGTIEEQKAKTRNGRGLIWYGAALGFYALGLMSKPMLVTWPCLLLLLDGWPLKRVSFFDFQWSSWRRLILEKLPFAALAVGTSLITMMTQRGGGATVPWDVLPLSLRLANIPVAYGNYLLKTLWPERLAAFYPYQATGWDTTAVWLSLLALGGITLWIIRSARTRPYLITGWCWFLGTLVPVIGLVQVGRQALADRYTYIPLIGFFIVVVWLAAELLERIKPPRTRGILASVTGIGLLTMCAGLSARQVSHWRNTATLAAHTAAVTEGNYLAHAQLAGALADAGQLEAAITEANQALAINPHYAEAHCALAGIYRKQGKLPEARAAYEQAVQCDPLYPDPLHGLAELALQASQPGEAEAYARRALSIAPLHLGARFALARALHNQGKLTEAAAAYAELNQLAPNLYEVHRGLGSVFMLQGKVPEAIQEFEAALRAQPKAVDGHLTLGIALLNQGQMSEAAAHFQFMVKEQATNAIAHYNLGLIRLSEGQPGEAAQHYRIALTNQPDWPEALNNLAWLLATCADPSVRNGPEAVKAAERACALTQNQEPLLLGTLAAAYAEAGKFSQAVSTAEQARQRAEAAGLTEVARRNADLIKQYQARHPYHEPALKQGTQPE